jgi:hypothetical protein
MAAPPRKRPLGQEQRRALLLLAGIPFGATDAAISANGIARQTLVSLVRAGLATTEREVKAGGQTIGRVRITEAARRSLDGGRAYPRVHVLMSGLAVRNAPDVPGVGWGRDARSVPHAAPALKYISSPRAGALAHRKRG